MPEHIQQSAFELSGLMQDHARLLQQIQIEGEALRDPDPRYLSQLWRESYHELFVDSVPKELLWQSEELWKKLSSENRLHPWTKDAIWVELIEAYGMIVPDEGYRLINEMPTRPAKAEAIAKFATYTSPVFIARARDALRHRDGNNFYGEHLFYNYEIVGRLGRDAKSCEAAQRVALDDYNRELAHFHRGEKKGHFHGRRVALSSVESKKSTYLNVLVRLTALGFQPAIGLAKEMILESQSNGVDRDKQMAVIAFVEHQLAVGEMSPIVPTKPADRFRMVDKWASLIESRTPNIINILKNDFHLPYAPQAFDQIHRLAHGKIDGRCHIEETLMFNAEVLSSPGGDVYKLAGQGGAGALDNHDLKDLNAACLFRAVKDKVFSEYSKTLLNVG